MKIIIVTDAWLPQVNGVVTTLGKIGEGLTRLSHDVHFVTPALFTSFPCPTYPEIRLSVLPYAGVRRQFETFAPDAVHIATEGPLGLAARRYCLKRNIAFTTAFHTRFAEYVHARIRVPVDLTYRWLRNFHAPSSAVMVPTPSVQRELQDRGFTNTVAWTRGVDTVTFCPGERDALKSRRPIFLYVGRVAVEKNIEAFLKLDLPGTKWVCGEGPSRAQLERRYPHVHFAGIQTAAQLARYYRAADVFVFPSLTDTFGLVMLEALACGTPVAAYPVLGPIDVIGQSGAGALHENLGVACMQALDISRNKARAYADQFSWQTSVNQFVSHLAPVAARKAA